MSALFVAVTAFALSCPVIISDEQRLSKAIVGWEAEDSTGVRHLERARIYSGRPSERKQLKPELVNDGFRWEVRGHETWVACEYQGTSVRVIRKLPSGATCKFKEPDRSGSSDASFACSRTP